MTSSTYLYDSNILSSYDDYIRGFNITCRLSYLSETEMSWSATISRLFMTIAPSKPLARYTQCPSSQQLACYVMWFLKSLTVIRSTFTVIEWLIELFMYCERTSIVYWIFFILPSTRSGGAEVGATAADTVQPLRHSHRKVTMAFIKSLLVCKLWVCYLFFFF
jgi:hypothetical protein